MFHGGTRAALQIYIYYMAIKKKNELEQRKTRCIVEEVKNHFEGLEDIVCVCKNRNADLTNWKPLCDYLDKYEIEINSVVAQKWFCDILEELLKRMQEAERKNQKGKAAFIYSILDQISEKVVETLNL